MAVDSDISPRQGRLFTRCCIIRITPIWSKLTKEPPPFQTTGHGRYQRWSRWNCDFISAINYLLSGGKIYEGTCERLWKSQLVGRIWQRRLIWWDILLAAVWICITSISCSLPTQLVSLKCRVCVGIPPVASNLESWGRWDIRSGREARK